MWRRHHHDRVKKLVVEPGNPHVIVSCGEDGVGAPCSLHMPYWQRHCTTYCRFCRDVERTPLELISM